MYLLLEQEQRDVNQGCSVLAVSVAGESSKAWLKWGEKRRVSATSEEQNFYREY
jgi:hypothetical protein